MPAARLSVWAVSDGRAGIENQALGLAEAVARLRPADIDVKRIRWRGGLGRLPTWAQLAPRSLLSDPEEMAPPWPDVWIAAGRASLPFSIRVRRWSGGRTFVIQTQDPGLPLDRFDLVVPPEHDGVTGPNVVSIVGSPNRITPARLADEARVFAAELEALPRPRVAVLIGGKSKAYELPVATAEQLARSVAEAVRRSGGAAMTTLSRRTPEAVRALLRSRLAELGPVYDGEGPNPYFAYLALADVAIVTADSANMLTEAATAGLPAYLLPLPGGAPKFERLHESLRRYGALRDFAGVAETWTYPRLAETDRAAAEIVRTLEAR